jgi:hypothetical protein
MDHLAWLHRQYRALLVREGELLDGMLALARIDKADGREYAVLKDELLAIGRHQSDLARMIRVPDEVEASAQRAAPH